MGKRPKKRTPKKVSQVSSAIRRVQAMLPGRTSQAQAKAYIKGKGRRRKRSAFWYAKEIQRMKLKRRYEKVKIGGLR